MTYCVAYDIILVCDRTCRAQISEFSEVCFEDVVGVCSTLLACILCTKPLVSREERKIQET